MEGRGKRQGNKGESSTFNQFATVDLSRGDFEGNDMVLAEENVSCWFPMDIALLEWSELERRDDEPVLR